MPALPVMRDTFWKAVDAHSSFPLCLSPSARSIALTMHVVNASQVITLMKKVGAVLFHYSVNSTTRAMEIVSVVGMATTSMLTVASNLP